MTREPAINLMIALGLLAFPLWAYVADEPFMITLSTRITILALAGIGLNIALGLGGLVSLGHAAFFGIGGYAMGILASHAQGFTPIAEWPFLIEGSKSMPVIWLTVFQRSSASTPISRFASIWFVILRTPFS